MSFSSHPKHKSELLNLLIMDFLNGCWSPKIHFGELDQPASPMRTDPQSPSVYQLPDLPKFSPLVPSSPTTDRLAQSPCYQLGQSPRYQLGQSPPLNMFALSPPINCLSPSPSSSTNLKWDDEPSSPNWCSVDDRKKCCSCIQQIFDASQIASIDCCSHTYHLQCIKKRSEETTRCVICDALFLQISAGACGSIIVAPPAKSLVVKAVTEIGNCFVPPSPVYLLGGDMSPITPKPAFPTEPPTLPTESTASVEPTSPKIDTNVNFNFKFTFPSSLQQSDLSGLTASPKPLAAPQTADLNFDTSFSSEVKPKPAKPEPAKPAEPVSKPKPEPKSEPPSTPEPKSEPPSTPEPPPKPKPKRKRKRRSPKNPNPPANPNPPKRTNFTKLQCTMCLKSFSRITHLEAHERSHSGSKPFKCDWEGCHRAFGQKSHLKRHIRDVHMKIRPHVCKACGQEFAQRSNFAVHLKACCKGGHPCYCGEEFKSQAGLIRHQRVAHGETKVMKARKRKRRSQVRSRKTTV